MISKGVSMGIFSYVLPLILIFAVVFAILEKTRLLGTGKKQLDAIVALVIAILAIQLPFVGDFFSRIFPNFGVGIAIFVVLMILTGLFYSDSDAKQKTVFMVIGIVLAVAIILWTFAGWQMWLSSAALSKFLIENFWTFVVIVMIVLIILAVWHFGKKKPGEIEATS